MQRFHFDRWVIASVVGAFGFWFAQVFAGTSTISLFMGEQIVAQGGYLPALTVWIGWGACLGVSLVYALLFAIIVRIPFSSTPKGRLIGSLIIAGALSWVTATLLTAPVLLITISLLSGQGFPSNIAPLDVTADLSIWNHFVFFFLVWLVYTVQD